MPEYSEEADTSVDDLALLALLYAGDLLDGDQTADFERLLEEEQDAREALADAASQLYAPEAPAAELRPSPAYRAHVKERLRQDGRPPVAPRRRRESTPLWAVVATAAAVLLVLGVSYLSVPLQHSWVGPHRPTAASASARARPGKMSALTVLAPSPDDGKVGGEGPGQLPPAAEAPEAPQQRRFLIVVFSDAWVVIRCQDG